jgi:MFS family permease
MTALAPVDRAAADQRRVMVAAGVGTVFEWYDFFLYSALATVIGSMFFGSYDESTRTVFALLVFALGFLARPFGALLWGRLGDRIGRQKVFLATIVVMGVATIGVGLLPTSAQIGLLAPALLVVLRVAQGLAISGEFGGAVTYVAENAPPHRRGLYTSIIPASIVGGLLLSLLVVLATQTALSAEQFTAWGWRVPFLASAVLMVVSVWARRRLEESPVFLRMREERSRSASPIREAFGTWRNLRTALVTLFGLSTATAVLGYAGTSYSLAFLTSTLRVPGMTANILFALVMVVGAVACVLFARLSDRIGRKPLVVAAPLLAAVLYVPVFTGIVAVANPALAAAQEAVPITVSADPAQCAIQFDPAATGRSASSGCDIARSALTRASASFTTVDAPPGSPATVTIGSTQLVEGPGLAEAVRAELAAAGYPTPGSPGVVRVESAADLAGAQVLALLGLLLVPVLLAQMVQGPAAAMIVELFPARIRYTALSLPYQIATGWIGGLLPATMFAMNVEFGDIYAGLWYPIGFAALAFVVSLALLPETRSRDVSA